MVAAEQLHTLNTKMIYAESVEEKSIDRFYNKHRNPRITHLELFGDGISFCLRFGNFINVLVVEDE